MNLPSQHVYTLYCELMKWFIIRLRMCDALLSLPFLKWDHWQLVTKLHSCFCWQLEPLGRYFLEHLWWCDDCESMMEKFWVTSIQGFQTVSSGIKEVPDRNLKKLAFRNLLSESDYCVIKTVVPDHLSPAPPADAALRWISMSWSTCWKISAQAIGSAV